MLSLCSITITSLNCFGISVATGSSSLMMAILNLLTQRNTAHDRPHCKVIGILIFLFDGFCSDIISALFRLTGFIKQLTKLPWQTVVRISRYLITTLDVGQYYCAKYDLEPVGIVNLNYTNDRHTRKPTSGFGLKMASLATARLHEAFALSSTEAKFIRFMAATNETIWLELLVPERRIGSVLCKMAPVIC